MERTSLAAVSKHFRLEEVAGGVYAAIALEGGAAGSNAGIIDLGGTVLVFDTFESYFAAQNLRQAAEELTGQTPGVVINSHGHLDHWAGNQVFAGSAQIISTRATREWMPAFIKDMEDLKKDPTPLLESIRAYEEKLKTETDERARKALESSILRRKYGLEALPGLRLTLPTLTFENRLIFYGQKRCVELLETGRGHTSGDCYLNLPGECIAFTGDLAFFQRQPYMVHSLPSEWIERLDELEQTCVHTFVPGHGPVGTKENIELEKAFIRLLEQRIRQAVQAREGVEAVLRWPLPEPFAAWSALPHEASVRSLYEKISREERE